MNALLKKIDEKIKQEQRNYKGPYCCLTMDAELERENSLLYYNFKYREHGIKIYKTNRYLLMKHCVYCGKELPSSLRIEWAETLQKEYKLSNPMNQDKKKIPKEFLTDEWWKKKDKYIINDQKINDNDHKNKIFKNKKPYCCSNLYQEILSDGSLLDYYTKFREYGIKVQKYATVMLIDYCLFCGTQFPMSVRNEWFDILEKEYGLESPYEEDKKKIPKEFLTDEWWKQRGL